MEISRTDFQKAKKILGYFEKPTFELIETAKNFSSILGELMESLHDAKVHVTRQEKNIEPLTHRYVFLSFSFLHLLKGTPMHLLNKRINWYDYSGSRVLLRSIVENYLTFDHLIIQPKEKEERDFRINIYEMIGYLNRRRINPQSQKEKDHIEFEKSLILGLLKEIKSSKYFLKLFKGKQTKIEKIEMNLKPESIFSISEMFENSLIRNSSTAKFWLIMSNHAHSEFIGINQVQYITQNNDSKEIDSDIRMLVRINLGLTSLYIQNLISKYKSAEFVFNKKYIKYEEELEFWKETSIKA
ncbi:MAG: hypothetical protein CFE21_18380 [Bacteroidetes bacterium B1(2017)]|nr:MAG: hypothetical protein CFE21_18380 [Bacteroidetes bacterium B1(2017)]